MEDKKSQLNFPVDVKPINADEVNVNSNIKVNVEKQEDGSEKISKTGKVDLLFFDNFTKSVVSRIVLDPYTARNFAKMLEANAKKLIEEVQRDDLPDEMKEKIKNQKKEPGEISSMNTYIG